MMKKSIKFISVFVIIILLAITLTGCTTTETGSKTTLTSNSENSTTESSTSKDKKYSVGEVYEDKNIAIKFVSVNENFTGYSKYATVKSGYKIVKADFEFENVGDSDVLASAYDFDCYADGYDCENFWSADDSGFSSTLSKGKKAKGSVYFQVPKDADEITLEYELNMWTDKKVEFIVK